MKLTYVKLILQIRKVMGHFPASQNIQNNIKIQLSSFSKGVSIRQNGRHKLIKL